MMMRELKLAVVCAAILTAAGQAQGATVTISTSDNQIQAGVDNQGWVGQTVANLNATNDNYFVGFGLGNLIRNYFAFDLSGVSGTVISAKLEARRYNSTSGTTYFLSDVSTPAADLVATRGAGIHAAIFNDLGTGTSYGSFLVGPGGTFDLLSFNLNANAITDINAAIGGFFSIGGRVDDPGPLFSVSSDEPGNSNTNFIQQLVLETSVVPEPSSLVYLVLGTISLVIMGRRQRKRKLAA